MPDFVHLHNHSHYSLLDGAARVDQLVQRAAACGMDAFALTDHGNLYGTLDFYKEAHKAGVKPILGCEVYVASGSRFEKRKVPGKKPYYHLVLLAKDQEGYRNLLRLVSAGFIEGYYYRPRVDFELIRKYHRGLIAQTACLGGEVNQALLREDWPEARRVALEYRELFGDDFYLEIQNHRIPDEDIARARMKELSDALAIPLVATNDIHYLDAEHVYAHDIYICVRDQKQHDPANMRYSTDQLYFKTQQEMYETFAGFEEACKITREIADKCNVDLDFGERHLPVFPVPQESAANNLDEYFEQVCREGLRERYGETPPEGAVERLEFEIGVIRKMGFPGYFLIVKDFIDYARANDIRVGPGRGSAAGSLVSYALGITSIDPLEFDLLFERFLNPERVSMPDIDIDFEDRHRSQVIDYVRQKYGEGNVAQIVTFGRLMTKAVIKDVCRVLGMNFAEADRFTKLIPDKLAMDKKVRLADVRAKVPELDTLIRSDARYERMWRNAEILEGLNRATGVHAAGVVITPGELQEFVPLQRAGGQDGEITTQWDGNWIDEIGLLKMDFLGLRALTVIKETQRRLRERGVEVDIERIPRDDGATFALFSRADTIGIFQFESSGMREYLRKLQPARLDDLIAMNALYRPGPMDNIPSYIERRHGREDIRYLHPVLEQHLQVTYGIIVYQEQVMQIARSVGGFSLGQADEMRRAMGKKKHDAMAKMKVDFLKGAAERDIEQRVADQIWDLLERFASYGFNKSHSAAYAWLAYQTGFLKANHTAEFLAAVMTDEMHDTKKMTVFLEECRKFGIVVLPPDVNESLREFRVVEGGLRFGFGAIKNVGDTAIQAIVAAREEGGPFRDLFDFVSRVETSRVNRKVLESLIQAGAFDALDVRRATLFAGADLLLNYASAVAEQRARNQISLFGEGEETAIAPPALEEVAEWDAADRLARERELIGIFVSGHPLERFRAEVESFATCRLDQVAALGHEAQLRACGWVSAFRTLINRRDKKMALGTLDDFVGSLKFMVFEDQLAAAGEALGPDALVSLRGRLSIKDEDDIILMVDDVIPLEQLAQRIGRRLTIGIDSRRLDRGTLEGVESLLRASSGDCEVCFRLSAGEGKPVSFLSGKYKVRLTPSFVGALKSALDGHSVVVSG
jgi:DNA polymerase III subunit alpha